MDFFRDKLDVSIDEYDKELSVFINAEKERQEKLRKSARQTAEETKRNNEAYHELKLKRINDNRKIRDRVHTRRRPHRVS